MENKTAIIIGAGPAGLTAAYELLKKTDIKPIVYEKSDSIGGISKTIVYNGNRIDIGGHRFFSKSERVVNWWLNFLPLQGSPAQDDIVLQRHLPFSDHTDAPDPQLNDCVMLIRKRISRIFFQNTFFDYPITLNASSLLKLGFIRTIKIIISYLYYKLFPIKQEKTLEDFFINRFGKELYKIFFKDYSEKIWGEPCSYINAEWGAQRVRGLSITKVLYNAFQNMFVKDTSILQHNRETVLIEQFMYPKFGPGQMWEEVANAIKKMGGAILTNHEVIGLKCNGTNINAVVVKNTSDNTEFQMATDYFFSTMPVKNLIKSFDMAIPNDVKFVSDGLKYRDFVTVGLLVNKMKIKNTTKIKTINNIIPDNWIYIQDKHIKMSRIQIYNNWSPYLVKNPDTIWMGIEFCCDEGDDFWRKPNDALIQIAINELTSLNMIETNDIIDSTLIREKKAYPSYSGTFHNFEVIKKFVDQFANLFLIGRNGMHKYNNMDHSMLTAMTAVDNIINKIVYKNNLWAVNTETDYYEEK